MEFWLKDLRHAFRGLVAQPLVCAIAVVTLALGIGANTAIFSILHAVLLRPLPYEEPSRLVTVWMDLTRNEGPSDEWASWDNFSDWREMSKTFESMTAISGWRPTLSAEGDSAAQQLRGGRASTDVFEVLGRHAVIGRDFTALEALPQGDNVALLSDEFFERQFGRDESIVGELLQLSSGPTRVVGVLPKDFVLPFVGQIDALAPLQIDASNSCGRGCVNLRVVGRLAAGATFEQAAGEMSNIAAQLEERHPAVNAGIGSRLIPLHERVTGGARQSLFLLMAAVGLVLLAACANVASMQLARALARREELAMRAALGASRGQLLRQLSSEALVLSLLGGGVGLLLGAVGVRFLRSIAATSAPRLSEATIDGSTLLFTFAVTIVTGALFGIGPALRASRTTVSGSSRRSGAGREAAKLRGAIVVTEVALGVVLLIGTLLLGRSLLELLRSDLGFSSEDALVARVALATDRYSDSEARLDFSSTVVERLEAVEGIRAVAHTNAPPLVGNDGDTGIQIEGRAAAEPGREPVVWIRAVDTSFFQTLQIPVVEGRAFSPRDRVGSPDVLILNEAAARRYWPDGDAVGKRVNFNSTTRWREIVGVASDTRHFGLTQPARPAAYLPYAQSPFGSPYFIVRTDGEPTAATSLLRSAVREIDPALAVAEVTTLDRLVGDASATERLLVWLLALFASIGVVLSAIGIYGVMSFVALQRRSEMGVRLALGARPGEVRRLLLRQGTLLAALGTAIGLLVAATLGGVLEAQLYGIAFFDPLTWLVVPMLLLLVAVAATWWPAWRSSRLDVVSTLRAE